MGKYLIYYTIGYTIDYIQCILLSIRTVIASNRDHTFDFKILCDQHMVEQIQQLASEISHIEVIPTPPSQSAQAASMKKITIFDYNIQGYEKVLYIDSDIVVNYDLMQIFDKIVDTDKLYAYCETTHIDSHNKLFFGLCTYTSDDIDRFRANNIYPFNAGFYGFIPSDQMKAHFAQIRDLIAKWEKPYFYEQSFLNYYFNSRGLVDYSVITNENYNMTKQDSSEGKLVRHFADCYRPVKDKYAAMLKYCNDVGPTL